MKLMAIFLVAMLLVVAVPADRRERGIVKDTLVGMKNTGNKFIDSAKEKFNTLMDKGIEKYGDPNNQAAPQSQE